jgi:hypothetical protein
MRTAGQCLFARAIEERRAERSVECELTTVVFTLFRGYYGCGNTYRSGSSSSYGQSYRTGDVITLQLDMDARTLSYMKNGTSLGVAFTDLPDQVYPAFSLYTKNDHFQLIDFGTF